MCLAGDLGCAVGIATRDGVDERLVLDQEDSPLVAAVPGEHPPNLEAEAPRLRMS